MLRGTLKKYFEDRGFGFIERQDEDEDVFVHVSQAEKAGIAPLREGMKLEFMTETDPRSGKTRAVDLRVVG